LRPKLRAAKFLEASQMQDINTDKQAFFQKTLYDPQQPRTRTKMPIKIQPGGTQDVSPTQEEINCL
jgi:hypothetical protein